MKRTAALAIATTLVAAACTSSGGGSGSGGREVIQQPGTGTGTGTGSGNTVILTPGVDFEFASALQPFDSCGEFLDHVKSHAVELVGPYGLDFYGFGGGPVLIEGDLVEESAATTQASADSALGGSIRQSAPQAGVDYSTTNVQEVGVDEPDIVKTDGERILALAQGQLHLIDVTGSRPVLLDSTDITSIENAWIQDMFLSGDTALLMGQTNSGGIRPGIAPDIWAPEYHYNSISLLVEIDLAGDQIEIGRRLLVDGAYVNARLVGDTARVVLQSSPTGLQFVYPEGNGLRAERRAIEANQDVIRNSTLDNWVPYYIVEDARGRVVDEGSLLNCERAHHPQEFAGLEMLSVLTVDLSAGLQPGDAVGVLAQGHTVYASTDNLYVANNYGFEWWWFARGDDAITEEPELTTEIHKFDISDPTRTEYRASGAVIGTVLNQFAMSEYEGDLRVATTAQPSWWGNGSDRDQSESYVTVLRENRGELGAIGQVGDLGRGEQIFSVRYVDDKAFVVTFRQVDPLYTIDLSDPTDPTVLGELKILGYSAYLHPVSDDLLLGIGQDATEEGRTTGTQVSLFDVSDLANPVRLDQKTLADGFSEAEYDHRAFLHWSPMGLAVLPVQRWSYDEETGEEDFFTGAIGVRVGSESLSEVGRISHMGDPIVHEEDDYQWVEFDWQAQIRRSVVVGDTLYTLSEKGLMASDLETLRTESFLEF